MLVLRRNRGESVVIDGIITIKVLRVDGGKVKLGFEAPQHVRILRKEVSPRDDEEEQS